LQKHYELECWKEQQELGRIQKQIKPCQIQERREAVA
jgi:hypothetical protein